MNLLYLLPVGSIEDEVLNVVEHRLHQELGFEIQKSSSLKMPVTAFNAVRNQYEALHLMHAVTDVIPTDATRVLAITEEDLSIPMLTFVYGQAQLGGRIALMSLARLRQEFYGLPENKELLLARAIKEALHELGHTFGLVHCPTQTCVMTLANDILHVDTKNTDFCNGCTTLLRDALHAL
jgi:archaemetzincin